MTTSLYPVVLCGGSGVRLWPASRRDRPKQFIDLVGDESLFQQTVRRVTPLVQGEGRLIVVAGAGHRDLIEAQLAGIGKDAVLLLEPEGRDSGPAILAAAGWIMRRSRDAVALFTASDHHVPDDDAFRTSVTAGMATAQAGRIVTFGVRPTHAATGYGYIRPDGRGLAGVEAFVEKPSADIAAGYVEAGYLWNSGNFLAATRTLVEEGRRHAPALADAVDAALAAVADAESPVDLGQAFVAAPKLSIDYAVMEKSDRVSVLPVDFAWSDLGVWQAVAETGRGARGRWIGADRDDVFVRAAPGVSVVTAGVSNLAIVAEPDGVLVCALDRSADIKPLIERLGSRTDPARWETAANDFDRWMRLSALPLWATLGVDEDGGFVEALDRSGAAVGDFRRARVQARQAFVYASAGRVGWTGPWRRLVEDGLARFDQTHLRSDGLYRTLAGRDGSSLDETPWLYDQAFALLALAAAAEAGLDPAARQASATRLLAAIETMRHPVGGYREAGPQPFQANAHMHLFEACLAWDDLDPGGPWRSCAEGVVALAREVFVDPGKGVLREYFTADWSPAPGGDGRLVEPGHQFEWAWLLARWARLTGDAWAGETARRLYQSGLKGVDADRQVAVDELDDAGAMRSARARLWPQTEWLKATLLLGDHAAGDRQDAALALAALNRYLDDAGLWRDKLRSGGGFVDEPAPASSFYHIAAAWLQMLETGTAS